MSWSQVSRCLRGVLIACAVWLAWGTGVPVRAAERTPRQLENVTILEHLGETLDPKLTFRNEAGEQVALGDFFKAGKPVILTLNYYQCQTLCSIQLNGFLEGLKTLDWKVGENFRVVTVSIDPNNTPAQAAEKRKQYAQALNQRDADWNFLVGDEANVRALADAVGFLYRFDAETNQFAHSAAVYFLSPEGKITRYLYGIEYSARDLKFALMDASQGKLGSAMEQLILRCFHYDETLGKYTPFAMNSMRTGAVVTVSALGLLLTILWRRDIAQRRGEKVT